MLETGRVCMKIAGRDAGKVAVIIDVLDENYVLIDGAVRRRKCNIKHLEPMDKKVKIAKNASHTDVLKALDMKEEKGKKKEKKEKGPRPTRQKVVKKKTSQPVKETKKEEKKPEPKKEATKKPRKKASTKA